MSTRRTTFSQSRRYRRKTREVSPLPPGMGFEYGTTRSGRRFRPIDTPRVVLNASRRQSPFEFRRSNENRNPPHVSSGNNRYQRFQNTPEFSVTQQTSTSEEPTQMRSLRSRSRTEEIIVPDSTSRMGTPPRRCTHTTRRVWYNDHWTEPLVSPLRCITRGQNLFETASESTTSLSYGFRSRRSVDFLLNISLCERLTVERLLINSEVCSLRELNNEAAKKLLELGLLSRNTTSGIICVK
nr:unnamed protein product [Haemonchus contortus]